MAATPVDSSRTTKAKVVRGSDRTPEIITMDSAYFTLPELESSFALVTDRETAKRMVLTWKRMFGSCVVGNRVVELPDSYELPRLDTHAKNGCGPIEDISEFQQDLDSPTGRILIRFSDLLVTLVAGSNTDIRKRFDRLGVDYAKGTLSTPEKWNAWLEGLRYRPK